MNESTFDSLYHLKELGVRDFDVPGHIPGQVNHGNDGFYTLQLIPLVSLNCKFILECWRKVVGDKFRRKSSSHTLQVKAQIKQQHAYTHL